MKISLRTLIYINIKVRSTDLFESERVGSVKKIENCEETLNRNEIKNPTEKWEYTHMEIKK